MENQIRQLIDDAIFDDRKRRSFELWPRKEDDVDLLFYFDQRQGITNVRFDGLDGPTAPISISYR